MKKQKKARELPAEAAVSAAAETEKEASVSPNPPGEARPSLRFRVKRIYRSGKALPEGTLLTQASQTVKALTADSGKKKSKKEKKPKAEKPKKAPVSTAVVPAEKSTALEAKEEKAPPAEAAPQKPKAKIGMFDYVRYAMLFFCFTVFLYSSYTLVDSLLSLVE